MTNDLFDSKSNLWEITRHLWSKYVNLSEEYKMLKEKWAFLEFTNSPALPLRAESNIFKAIDSSVSRLNTLFGMFNLTKDKRDRYPDFYEAPLNVYQNIQNEFFYLVSYVGLLKLAYFQRTVALEMAHTMTGFPQSPEKTIGSELIYVAADKVAKVYSGCIKSAMKPPYYTTPFYQWDEFVSFVPPITSSTFYGAFCRTSPYGLYHLSLSEEQKSMVCSLLILAHEVGHVPAFDPNTDTGMREEYVSMSDYVFKKTISAYQIQEEEGRLLEWYKCRYCRWNPFNWPDTPKFFLELFEQVFADLIGLKIGGPMTIEVFLNETYPADEAIVRSEIIHTYMREKDLPNAIDLNHRINDVVQRKKTFLHDSEGLDPNHPEITLCLTCLRVLGKTFGGSIYNYEQNHKGFFSRFIKRKKEFSISVAEEEQIINSLKRGIPCSDFDVRKILHAYARAFKSMKEPHERPRYPITLYSIAFNEG